MKVAKFLPERIVIYNRKEVPVQPPCDGVAIQLRNHPNSSRKVKDYPFSKRSLVNLGKPKSNPAMSKSSKREFRNRVLSMLYLSKPRTIFRNGKSPIYNYRQSFHTLTLPASQCHSDVEIKQALNLFLNNLRQVFKIENYVWKAELQGNDNIHFHLIIDKYIDYHSLRYYWNQQLDSLGYIDLYADKFLNMDWEQYKEYRVNQYVMYGKEPDLGKIRNAYNSGKSSGWRSPNSVDSRNVRSDKDVYKYLEKYLSKEVGDVDNERIQSFGRLWSSSQSLSRLKYRNVFEYDEIKSWVKEFVSSSLKSVKEVVYDYCSVIYFRVREVDIKYRNFIYKLIRENAKLYKYPVPVP